MVKQTASVCVRAACGPCKAIDVDDPRWGSAYFQPQVRGCDIREESMQNPEAVASRLLIKKKTAVLGPPRFFPSLSPEMMG